MPIVKRESRIVLGEPFRFEVSFSGRTGMFTAKLPLPVSGYVGTAAVQADTLERCERAFADAVTQFKQALQVKTKVILFEVKARGKVYTMDADGEIDGVLFDEDSLSFANGLGLSVEAGVFEETETRFPNGTSRFKYERLDSVLDNGMVGGDFRGIGGSICESKPAGRLEWTAEREGFFEAIRQGMVGLIQKIISLKDENVAARLADTGRFLTTGKRRAGHGGET